jgi:hypothetical protein
LNWKIGITACTLIFLIAGCANKQPSPSASQNNQVSTPKSGTEKQEKPVKSNEKPLPPEKSPVGDIPDSQAFVNYTSVLGGYSIVEPEGWSRTENGSNASFIDKFNGVKVSMTSDSKPFNIENIKNNQVKTLIANGRAITINEIKEVTLPSGKAVLVKYYSNSDPNPVSNKQIRLENQTFFFYKAAKVGSLTVWAPLGSDNVDQWKKISESWRWK